MLLSVLIPSYNRREILEKVLRAYEAQRPHDLPFELVIVDDGSSDGTANWLATQRPERFTLRFAVQENAGPARARNRALELASGQLILITGDDIEPAPDLLTEHLRAHRAHDDPRVAVLGLTRWPSAMPTTNTMRHIDGAGAQQFSYAHMKDGAEYDFRHFYTSNISLHRALIDREPAGFSTDFPAAAFEDAEYAYRLCAHGLRIVYHAAAVGHHHHAYTASGFFRRQARCGEMAAILYDKFPETRGHLDLDYLETERLAMLGRTSDLDAWQRAEDRALRFSERLDPLPFPVDEWLVSLFRYGYLKGLAKALYRPSTAQRLSAHVFNDLIPKAAQKLGERAWSQHLPVPRDDLEHLSRPVPAARRTA